MGVIRRQRRILHERPVQDAPAASSVSSGASLLPSLLASSPAGPYSRPVESGSSIFLSSAASPPAASPSGPASLALESCGGAEEGLRLKEAEGEKRLERLLEKSVKTLSRGQRKRLAKREAGERRRDFAAYAEALKKRLSSADKDEALEGPASALDDLTNFSKALAQVEEEDERRRPNKPSKLTWKKKSRMKKLELRQYDAVVNFDAFNKSPLQVLGLHIRNSLQKQQKLQSTQQSQG